MAFRPTIYNRSEAGLRAANSGKYGPLGEIYAATIHHSAGPRAKTKAQAQKLNRAYQIQHINQGWGDIGYHFCIDDLGRIYRLRPIRYKGAHVGLYNTGNVGIMVHGNYEKDRLTWRQRRTLRWLLNGGLKVLTGEPESGYTLFRGHKEWPGHRTNACPGRNLMGRVRYLRNKYFH